MNCNGRERRKEIVKNYNVLPVAHIQLLAGQKKHSDAKAIIKNDYYIFEATNKITGKKEIIQCGMVASQHFLELLNHSGLPVFNPLHGEGRAGDSGEDAQDNSGNGGQAKRVWNPLARQLYNAIMWVIVIIDAKPNTPIYEIREKVYKFRDREPFQSQIKAVNTIIGKSLQDKTLTEAINELRAENDIKDNMCQFDLLINAINDMIDRDGSPLNIRSLY